MPTVARLSKQIFQKEGFKVQISSFADGTAQNGGDWIDGPDYNVGHNRAAPGGKTVAWWVERTESEYYGYSFTPQEPDYDSAAGMMFLSTLRNKWND